MSKLAREQWLTKVGTAMCVEMKARCPELDFGKWRITCGFPSSGGMLGRKRRTRGECWHKSASADGHSEVFISPVEGDAREVAHIVAHELIHAGLPAGVGHKAPFAKVCKAIGLQKPWTATTPTPEFWAWADAILAKAGPYPHATLNASGKGKVKKTYLVKAECPCCGYTVRVTQKWLDLGSPICPLDNVPMVTDGSGEDEE